MKEHIDEMTKVLVDYTKKNHIMASHVILEDYAEHLYNEGYRKQSEGVWIYNPDGIDLGLGAWQCSQCGCNNHNLPTDKNTNPLVWAGGKYCPNCGAKMKGGAE